MKRHFDVYVDLSHETDFEHFSNVLCQMGIPFSPEQIEDITNLCQTENSRPIPKTVEDFIEFYLYLQEAPFLQARLNEVSETRKQREAEFSKKSHTFTAISIPHELKEFHQRSPALVQSLLEMSFPVKYMNEALMRFSTSEACVEYIFQRMAQPEGTPMKSTIFTSEIEQDCGICGTPYPVSELLTLSCDHRLCNDCFVGNCESKIKDGQVKEDQLYCPCILDGSISTICKQPIDIYILRAHLPESLMERYDRFITREFCESQHLCRCPQCNDWYVDVTFGELPAEIEVWKSIACQACQHSFCGKCGQRPHRLQKDQDITCEQYAKWKEENDKSEDLMQGYMKENRVFNCPGCKHGIERLDGCKFMTCSKCHTNSCNLCGAKLIQTQHYSHFNNGPYGEVCKGPEDGAQ